MKYIKLNLSLGDKLRLLFLGVVPECSLPIEIVEIVQVSQNSPVVSESPKPEKLNTNEEEEKFSVPFFNFDDDETKSNF